MTPTLFGRWQSRFFLLSTLGGAVTLLFAIALRSLTPFVILAAVFFFGLIWDALYMFWQRQQWDRDWPPIMQLLSGIIEAVFIGFLLYRFNLITPPPFFVFVAHYSLVWLVTFIASQSVMRLIFPRWRFDGGQWL